MSMTLPTGFRSCPAPGWIMTSSLMSLTNAVKARECQHPAVPTARPAFPGFEVLGVLGRGGMGVVYKARDLTLKRLVALKVILAGEHAGERECARFKVEAETIAALQHPNIVQIHQVGEHDGKQFLSLEYCAGGSLDALLQGTPLPPRAAAEVACSLARAVHAAHQARIVHRDLKPANVLLQLAGTGSPTVHEPEESPAQAANGDRWSALSRPLSRLPISVSPSAPERRRQNAHRLPILRTPLLPEPRASRGSDRCRSQR